MEVIRRSTPLGGGPLVSRPRRAAAIALALAATLTAGFSLGRASAPTQSGARSAASAERKAATSWPIAVPSGAPGRVWGHWDSAPGTSRTVSGPLADGTRHARHHHRVKWGD